MTKWAFRPAHAIFHFSFLINPPAEPQHKQQEEYKEPSDSSSGREPPAAAGRGAAFFADVGSGGDGRGAAPGISEPEGVRRAAGRAVRRGEMPGVDAFVTRNDAAEAVAAGRDDQGVAAAPGCDRSATLAHRELRSFGQAVECAERNDDFGLFGRHGFGRHGADFMPGRLPGGAAVRFVGVAALFLHGLLCRGGLHGLALAPQRPAAGCRARCRQQYRQRERQAAGDDS